MLINRALGNKIISMTKAFPVTTLTGLLCSLLDIHNPDQLKNHYLRGNIFETYIISEYIKARFHQGLPLNLFFWRDNTGHEIDLLLEEGDGMKAVEIKSGVTINEDFFKGLEFFKKLAGFY
jgi:uncharacterized protein